jgi:hypothetical protein
MAAGVAPSPFNYSNLVDTNVLPEFADWLWKGTARKRFLIDSLTQNKAIQSDADGGKYLDWRITVGDFGLDDHADMGQRTFTRVNTEVTYTAPWAFLETTDAVSENDWAMLSSEAGRGGVIEERSTKVVTDQIKKLNKYLLTRNCESSGNSVFGITAYTGSQKLGGLPTLFGYGTTTTGIAYDPTVTSVATVAAGIGSKEVIPQTTYFGVSTHPVNTLAGVPDTMRVQEATSPVIANWSATSAWNTAASSTWVKNALYVVDHMITRQCRDGTAEWYPDIGVMTQSMYQDFKTAIRGSIQQHVVLENDTPTSPDIGMYKRFFIRYQGVILSWDIDQATNLFYLLNTKKAKFRSLDTKVAGFTETSPYETGKKRMMTLRAFPDANVGAFKFISKMGGQIIWEPSAQGAAYPLA